MMNGCVWKAIDAAPSPSMLASVPVIAPMLASSRLNSSGCTRYLPQKGGDVSA